MGNSNASAAKKLATNEFTNCGSNLVRHVFNLVSKAVQSLRLFIE